MVRGNIRKDNSRKLVNNFLSIDEIQELRQTARADELNEALFEYQKFAITEMKPSGTVPEVRHILNKANAKHFPDKIQEQIPELATETGIISIPFKMIEVGGKFMTAPQ